tara:strand:+ start:61036 stop:61710 length:675 start_codon:yes stop_codon:yes gene_type:complete
MGFRRQTFLENRDNIEVEWFEKTWGRKPKIWNVSSLYSLWIKTNERAALRSKARTKCIEEIVAKIAPDKYNRTDKYTVYYKDDKRDSSYRSGDDKLYKVHIQYEPDYDCYSTSHHGYVGDSIYKDEKRNDIFDSIIDDGLKLELGTKFRDLDKLTNSWFSSIIFKNIWKIIEPQLRELKIKNDVFPISICGDEYYVITDLDNYHYPKYNLVSKSAALERKKIEF